MITQTPVDQSEFGRNVYVASLPIEFDDEQLFNLFAPYGPITSARIMRAKGTRQSKGYGFVLYRNPRSAELAISNLVGHVIGGNRIQVRLAHPDASFAYSGQRGARSSSNSTPGSRPLQGTPPTTPPQHPQQQQQQQPPPLLMPQGVLPPTTDSSVMMTAYPVPTLYPTMYPSVVPSVLTPAPATATAVPGGYPSQVMLVPQFAPQMQQMTPQRALYMVVPDTGISRSAFA